ncbi:MAG: SpoIIE family protein phosphatase [Bacillota bacterium]
MEQIRLIGKAKNRVIPYVLRREFRYEVAIFFLAVLFGSAAITERMAPFGPAVLAAAWMARHNPYYALLGAIAGALAAGRYEAALCAAVYFGVCMLWKLWRGEIKRADKLFLLAVAQLLMMPLFYMHSIAACLLGIGNLAACVVMAAVFRQGMMVVWQLRLRRLLSNEEQISMIAIMGVAVLALSKLTPFGVSLGAAAAVLLCILSVCVRGAAATAVAVVLGAALVLGGEFELLIVGNLAICTLSACAMRPMGRYGVTVGFGLCSALVYAYLGGKYALPIPELVIGAFGATLIPRKAAEQLAALCDAGALQFRREHTAAARLRERTSEQLLEVANVFREVAGLFVRNNDEKMPEREKNAVAAGAAMCVCSRCSGAQKCWRDAEAASDALLVLCESQSKIQAQPMPEPLEPSCHRREQLRNTVLAALEQYALRAKAQRREREYLEFTNRQLEGICSVIQTLSTRASSDARYDEELEARLLMRLDRDSIRVKKIDAIREKGRIVVNLELRNPADAVRACDCVSRTMKKPFRMRTHSVRDRISLEQAYTYDARFGVAASPAPGSAISGDSLGVRELGDGKLLYLMSDGMGSGEMAHRESSAAVALLGDLLSVGFDSSIALESVNRLLIARNSREMYATLDAFLLDMADGAARFIKYGAPPSYIIRDGRVNMLYCEALPVGVIEEARPAVHHVQLRQGDIVVMMTDGVSDALGTELTALLLEMVVAEPSANDAAQALVLTALEKEARDDMSVMVIHIGCV